MFQALISRGDRRRLEGIVSAVQELLPDGPVSLLDVGCGSGILASRLVQSRPGLSVEGIDVVVQPNCAIRMSPYDGHTFPFADASFDVVLCADMLHHTIDPGGVLAEATRVARQWVIVKDHVAESWWDHQLLTALDWIGNVGTGVPMPYNFLSHNQWRALFDECGVIEVERRERLRYWFWPLTALADRDFHFAAKLAKASG